MDPDPSCGRIVDLAHHAASDPSRWDGVARELRRLLRARIVGLFEHNFVTGQGDVPHSAGIHETFRMLYRSRFARQNPWLTALRQSAAGKALTAAELVPNWALVRTEFYRDWLRPQQIFHGLIGITFRSPEELGCVIALRQLKDAPFDSADKRRLGSMLPHLECAWELSDEFACQRRITQVLLDLLAELPEAAIVLDGEARPIVMNRAAELLLAQNDGLTLAKGTLSACSGEDATSLRSMIVAASGNEGPGRSPREFIIRRPSGGAPMLVRLVSLSSSAVNLPGKRQAVAAILVRPVDPPRTDRNLCRYYGMTLAETRLADLIVVGYSLAGAAQDLHITKNTARTHMKRIYAKTDTHRQSDLVRLLATRFGPSEPAYEAILPSDRRIGAASAARHAEQYDGPPRLDAKAELVSTGQSRPSLSVRVAQHGGTMRAPSPT